MVVGKGGGRGQWGLVPAHRLILTNVEEAHKEASSIEKKGRTDTGGLRQSH